MSKKQSKDIFAHAMSNPSTEAGVKDKWQNRAKFQKAQLKDLKTRRQKKK